MERRTEAVEDAETITTYLPDDVLMPEKAESDTYKTHNTPTTTCGGMQVPATIVVDAAVTTAIPVLTEAAKRTPHRSP